MKFKYIFNFWFLLNANDFGPKECLVLLNDSYSMLDGIHSRFSGCFIADFFNPTFHSDGFSHT